MSRHLYPIAVTTILLVAASLSGEATAQRGRPGAPAAPHPAMAAPHFAAPAPHFAAPTPHFAAPMAAAPHFAAPARSFAPRELSRHAPTLSPEASRPSLANSRTAPVDNRAEQRQPASTGQTVGSTAHQTRGQSQATANRSRTEQARTQPILQNPVFANQRMAVASHMTPSQSTFRGQFAQAGWGRDWRHRHRAGIVLGFIGPLFWP